MLYLRDVVVVLTLIFICQILPAQTSTLFDERLSVNIIGGITRVDWDGYFFGPNGTYDPRTSFFLGADAENQIGANNVVTARARVLYKVSKLRESSFILQYSDVSASFGAHYRYKKLTFGAASSLSYVIDTQKIGGLPNGGFRPEGINKLYASLSNSIELALPLKLSIFAEYSWLSTGIVRSQLVDRFGRLTGEIDRDYARWLLVGFRRRLF